MSAVPPPSKDDLRVAPSPLSFLRRHADLLGVQPAWRLALKALTRPRAFHDWLAELGAFQQRRNLDEVGLHAYVVEPLRPFMRAGLALPQRLAISRAHHALTAERLTEDALRAIWAGRPLKLCALTGRRDTRFALWLARADYVREGALELVFARDSIDPADAAPLARATFSLACCPQTGGRPALLIGGLQGGPRLDGKRLIVDATRDLRGMRPKTVAALALQAFAHHAGCARIFAVSDETHVINLRGVAKRGRKTASYDAFWLERGGVAGGFLGFELPIASGDPKPDRQAIFDGVATAFAPAPAASTQRFSCADLHDRLSA